MASYGIRQKAVIYRYFSSCVCLGETPIPYVVIAPVKLSKCVLSYFPYFTSKDKHVLLMYLLHTSLTFQNR
jgi:hypothetical protein